MKKQLLFLLVLLLSFNSYSQNSFEKGYFINNSDQKINCLIKNLDWNNNPTEIQYKLSENDEINKFTVESVKEFGIDNNSKYINSKVNIDRSTNLINKLTRDRNPIFKEENLFLKVLIEGKASLYEYLDHGLTRYFYNAEKTNIEQLVFKKYEIDGHKIAKNEKYKQQLFNDLKCPDFTINKFKNLRYSKYDLTSIFKEYNKCLNSDLVYLEPTIKRDFFNLNVRPRINNSSLKLMNSTFNSKDVIDFGNKTGFGIGIEAEIILPINKNKWTLLIEPTYQSFKSETTNTNVSVIFGGEIKSKIDYKSIEIPIGLRHYFNLTKNSMVFINASYVFELSPNSSFEYYTSASSNPYTLKVDPGQNMAFGLGYKLNDKYSLEIRYQTSRDLNSQNQRWTSEYKTLAVIFGYTLF